MKRGARGALGLGGGGDIAFDSQMGEESDDFGSAHRLRMAFVVEEAEAFDPVHLSGSVRME